MTNDLRKAAEAATHGAVSDAELIAAVDEWIKWRQPVMGDAKTVRHHQRMDNETRFRLANKAAEWAYTRRNAEMAEKEKLLRLVDLAESIFMHCTVTDGMCCCGDDIKGHSDPMICGHSPVDHGSYQVGRWLEKNNSRRAAAAMVKP